MTTNNPTPAIFGNSSLGSGQRVPGLPELIVLLNFVPKPALIADRNRGTILGANHAFLGLTAFDQKEVVNQPISFVLSGLAIQDAVFQDMVVETLKRRMRDPIPVTVQVRSLEASGPLVLVLVNAEIITAPKQELLEENVANAILGLTRLPQDEKPEESVSICAEIIFQAMGVGQVVIYQANPGDPHFRIVARSGDIDIFPDTFSSADMVRLGNIKIWQPGKRMHVDLHRAGRVHKLNFVASAPLGQMGMWMGLLVIGGTKPLPEKLETFLALFAAQVTRIIEQHLLVTELKRQISESWQSLMVSQVITDNSSMGILLVSAEMTIQLINPAAEWILGYADWEVKGQPVENVLVGVDTLQPALEAAARGIATHSLGNISMHHRLGQSFPAHIQTIPVYQEGQTGPLVVFISDISENEEIRQRSQQLEQRAVLGEVTAVFAHEVRNPINNIYSGLQLLAAELPADDPRQANLTRLQHDCVRLTHLMESVLNFSRTNKYQFERVDVRQLIQRLLDRWKPRFTNVKVVTHFNPTEKTYDVAGDARALEQVFTNLISNAVEAMAKNGGNLAIRIEPLFDYPNRSQVIVSVSDTGPGIPDDIRPRIFEPFVTTKAGGTGLGLAITKRIVVAHHGSIQVNSFPGGTVFEVTLLAYIDKE